MSKKNILNGSCSCGNVKYKIINEPLFTQACHCKDCKKSTGSSFVIHTMVLPYEFQSSGDVASTELPTGSGKGVNAYFCKICGFMFFVNIMFLKEELQLELKLLKIL